MIMTREEQVRFYKSYAWQKVRQEAIARDHNECVWCAEEGKVTDKSVEVLEVDHIKELANHPELALDLNNLRTLCKTCHNKRHDRFGYGIEQKTKKYRQDEWWGPPP